MPSLTFAGLSVTEHTFTAPLDHDEPAAGQIELFARSMSEDDGGDRPWIVYLQGGPGFESPRPTERQGWLTRLLRDYRVLLLDQRGTGRSRPLSRPPAASVAESVSYLTRFRADSIVRDAEQIRRELGVERWSIIGQSFGGFCATHYLSRFPDSLEGALITGGLPPLDRHPDDVYRATFTQTIELNRRYHARYPQDAARLAEIRRRLDAGEVTTPDGEPLSWRRFRALGQGLGMSGAAERLHYLLELPPDSSAFRHDVASGWPFSRNPLYAVIHEASYASGHTTNWSAARVMPDEFSSENLLTGEHVFPWMFEEDPELRPWREVAEGLAQQPWPVLYEPEVLARNQVPVAAAIYLEDQYVPREFSEETARRIGNLRTYRTDEYVHDGIRASGDRVVDRLLTLLRDTP